MKRITAYVNTHRVHWLVEELEAVGISEIMVTEYFSPSSKISRFLLVCEDESVEAVRSIIHRVGTNGSLGDHYFDVAEFDPKMARKSINGLRISPLED